MNWENIYDTTVKVLCERPIEEFDFFVNLEMPKFMETGVGYFEEEHENELSSMRLHKELATDEDYKEFCEWIYNYIGDDLYNYVDDTHIKVFGKRFDY